MVGCWTHARRRFDEALQTLPKEMQKDSPAAIGECYCSRLFKLEHCNMMARFLKSAVSTSFLSKVCCKQLFDLWRRDILIDTKDEEARYAAERTDIYRH